MIEMEEGYCQCPLTKQIYRRWPQFAIKDSQSIIIGHQTHIGTILANVANMKLLDLYTYNHGPFWCGVVYSATSKCPTTGDVGLAIAMDLRYADVIQLLFLITHLN